MSRWIAWGLSMACLATGCARSRIQRSFERLCPADDNSPGYGVARLEVEADTVLAHRIDQTTPVRLIAAG
jgi:hypothetical protein